MNSTNSRQKTTKILKKAYKIARLLYFFMNLHKICTLPIDIPPPHFDYNDISCFIDKEEIL